MSVPQDFKLPPFVAKAEKAMKEAVAAAVADHWRAGRPVYVWRDGRAAELFPDGTIRPLKTKSA